MQLPVIHGLIDRRILVNYQADADVLARLLPPPFRPRLVNGVGMAGICLIRLKYIRPRGLPWFLGLSSENVAHRIAVAWDEEGVPRQGVYILRRDSSNWLNCWAGGRAFPGVHHHARFDVKEQDDCYRLAIRSDEDLMAVRLAGRRSQRWPADSIFQSLQEASSFFEVGSLGYSPARQPASFEAMELRTASWKVEALEVTLAESSFFDHPARFPRGSVRLDHALLMRGVKHEWRQRPMLQNCLASRAASAAG